eukprot:TRINITY_DN18630_c0_g1_i1.p1 TRINITY_DN18630_c0_g1~~TRINITY_DN18630_c0_g1_i1.p1  ORF type:complete len:123 (+),score=36.16 TRINITY_DN18630_c0_g1_i1:69-437(+)
MIYNRHVPSRCRHLETTFHPPMYPSTMSEHYQASSFKIDNTLHTGSEDREVDYGDELGPDMENEDGTEGLDMDGDSQTFAARSKEEEKQEFNEMMKRVQQFESDDAEDDGSLVVDTTDPSTA